MKTYRLYVKAFGTLNTFVLYGVYAQSALIQIKQYLLLLDNLFSAFNPDSEISLINQNAGKAPVKVSTQTIKILKASVECSKLSEGAFDITVGKMTKAWRSHKKALSFGSYDNIIINETENSIFLQNKTLQLDLGGIAKGYAINEVKQILRQYQIENAIINLGGSVCIVGQERLVGIRNPFTTETTAITLSLKNETAVTSGIYEQYRLNKGKISHHILNPKNGRSAKTDLLSATVIDDDGAKADALATAFVVMGFKESTEFCKKHNTKAVFILNNGNIFTTENIKELIA